MSKRRARTPSPGPTRLFRVFPWLPDTASDEPGHPLYAPPLQGAGRIDNPAHYRVLYASESPVGAVAEAFGNHAVWTADLFRMPGLPGARRALATYEAKRLSVLDLDDARVLLVRKLRPSDVVTRDRERTRRWSLAIFRERKWDGARWWSFRDPDRGAYGLWSSYPLSVLDVTPLDVDHPTVTAAARLLARPIVA